MTPRGRLRLMLTLAVALAAVTSAVGAAIGLPNAGLLAGAPWVLNAMLNYRQLLRRDADAE